MDIYLWLYLVIIVAPAGVLFHEMGHVLGAKIISADYIRLSIGIGKIVKTISLKKIRVTIQAIFFLGGSTQSERKTPYKSLDIIIMTVLGPISSGVFAFIFYVLYNIFPNHYLQLLFLFNLWLAFVNIIPFKIKRKQSDGYTILKLITQKGTLFK